MEYDQNFEKIFMQRTLEILREYEGIYDASLLLNCLLGLLIVPNEKSFSKLPEVTLDSFGNWGISPDSVDFGENSKNLRTLVRKLRNAVAHFKVLPLQQNGECVGFEFRDKKGFHAQLSLTEIKEFTTHLAQHLAIEKE